MPVTPLPIVTLVNPVQPSNVYYPIIVTLSGIVTFVRLVQFANARTLAMLFTLFGIVTLVRSLQPWNALSMMLVTLFPILTATGLLMTAPELSFIPASTRFEYSIGPFQPNAERSPPPKSNIVAYMSERFTPPSKF